MDQEQGDTLSSSAIPQARGLLRHHVKGGELFQIFIVNLVLTVLTLGVYRFWAKTRLRRYVWGSLEIMGDRLEYTGTGKELFFGFLVVFVLILMPVFGGIAALEVALAGYGENLKAALGSVQFLVIIFLMGVAFFRARRYRLTRTHWRGIYGSQSGSAIKYGLMALASYFALAMTFGLAWPVCSVWLKRYEMDHTWIGNEQLGFTPSVKKLYGSFVVVWLCGVLYMTVAATAFWSLFINADVSGAMDTADVQNIGYLFAIIYASALPFALSFLWYRGRAYNHFISSTTFHGHQLSSTVTGFGYLWLMVSNSFLVIFTLGLGTPWTYVRYLNYVQRNVGLIGDGDFSALLQSTQEKPSHGEGLADAFDVGGI